MTKAEREIYRAEFVTGDYRTLKEFAEAKGIAYSEVQKASMLDKWMEAKRKNVEYPVGGLKPNSLKETLLHV